MENCLHAHAIAEVTGVSVEVTDTDGLPLSVARGVHEAESKSKPWDEVTQEQRAKKESRAKRRLSDEVVERITPECLAERDPDGEVQGWLRTIGEMLQHSPAPPNL